MPGESMLMLCGSGASKCVVRGMVLVQRKQDLLDLVTGLYGLCMGFEAVTEVPRFVVKIRVAPGKACNHAVTQNEKVMFACAWQPALGVRRGHRFP